MVSAVAGEVTAEDGGYIHHLILCKGWLWKRSNKSGGIAGNLQYRKRYFELSNTALTYRQNEKKTDVSLAECGCWERGGGYGKEEGERKRKEGREWRGKGGGKREGGGNREMEKKKGGE